MLKLPSLNTEITWFEKVTTLDLLALTKHLSLMLKSGITLAEAVSILVQQTQKTVFRRLLEEVHQELANGQSLHKALMKFPRVFDPFFINLIKAADESGTLEKNLDYLSDHLKKRREFVSKVQGALLYPGIVLSVAVVAGLGLSFFVLPKLVDLFSSLDVELPLSTKILIWFAQLMKNHGGLVAICLVASAFLLRYLVKTRFVRPWWDRVVLRTPIFGQFLQNIELASIFRNLGTMLSVGVPIAAAIDVQTETTPNTVYKYYLQRLRAGVGKGKSAEEVFSAKDVRFIPLLAVRMIGTGEKTGRLDETLLYLGEYYENEVDEASKNLATVLEPVILVCVGLVVAFIAIAIIGPIYQFTGSVGR